MIALVRGGTAASIFPGSINASSPRTSTSTGSAPVSDTAKAVEAKVIAGTMTSSPSPRSRARQARYSASVPLATPIACGLPQYSANSSSKIRSSLPRIKSHRSSTLPIAASISSAIGRCWDLRSTSGIGLCAARMWFIEDLAGLTSITALGRNRRVEHAAGSVDKNAGRDERNGKKNEQLVERGGGDADRAGGAGELDHQRISELQCANEGGPGRQQGTEARGAEQDQRIGEAELQADRLDDQPQRERIRQINDQGQQGDCHDPPRAQDVKRLSDHHQLRGQAGRTRKSAGRPRSRQAEGGEQNHAEEGAGDHQDIDQRGRVLPRRKKQPQPKAADDRQAIE